MRANAALTSVLETAPQAIGPTRKGAFGPAQVLLFPLALASLITGLELWAWWRPPAGLAFSGIFWAPEDIAPYWSAMREAAGQSGWLIHDRLTSEPHQPALIYPLYLAVAKFAAAFGAPIEAAHFGFAWLARTFFLLSLAALIAAFVAPHRRRAAYALAIAGGGFAFFVLLVAAVARQPNLVGDWAVDWRYIELNTFMALFSYPHHLVSLGCLAILLVLRLKLDSGLSIVPLLGLAATVVLMALANSFALVPAGVGLAMYGLWRVINQPSAFREELTIGLVFLAVASPFLFYTWRTFAQDPFWATAYGAQNVPHLLTPPLLPLLSSLGLLLPLGLVGVIALIKERPRGWALLTLWLIALLVLMLLPLPYQRRYGLGLPMLLAVLASRGLLAVSESAIWQRLPHGLRQVGGYAAFLALFSSAIGITILVLSLAFTGRGAMSVLPVFERATVVEAARWLANESTHEDVVLAEWPTANVAIRYIPGRTVSGHPIATLDPAGKDAVVRRFFDPTTPQDEREKLIRGYGVTLVIVGPRERALGASEDTLSRDSDRMYRNEDVSIYRLKSAGDAP